jgi:predicted site-specific integrase-resolvase
MTFDYPEPFVGADAVLHHLGGISRMTLWRYVQAGMPVHTTRNGRHLYKLSEVDHWLFESACTATPPGSEGVA